MYSQLALMKKLGKTGLDYIVIPPVDCTLVDNYEPHINNT